MKKSEILFVDDEVSVLESFKRQLHKSYQIDTAQGSREAFKIIEQHGHYSVIISDYSMPEMNGIEFLSRIKKISPNTVRIMLTGKADLQVAMSAVNDGNIFRFLTKPCDTETILKAIAAGIKQHNLIVAEKMLLEKTLKGSIKVLIDILSMISPLSFGKASRVKNLVKKIANELEIKYVWEIELAALLSQIGCIALTDEIVSKVNEGESLSGDESQMFIKHPDIAFKLISNIPRLENVASIIKYQNLSELPEGHKLKEKIEVGSKILKISLDYDHITNVKGAAPALAIAQLFQEKDPTYDTSILEALKKVLATEKNYELKKVKIHEITTNMILAENIITDDKKILLAKGQEITDTMTIRLNNFMKRMTIMEPVEVFVMS
jgi:response regulator RpfG family c-di-GMP phosphodiesterase